MLIIWGCSESSNLIQIEICGDLVVPVEVDALRVSTLDEDRNEAAASLTELVEPDVGVGPDAAPEADADLPDAELSDAGADEDDGGVEDAGEAPPPEGDPLRLKAQLRPGHGQGWVLVQGLRDGLEVIRAEARGGEGETVSVPLDRACLGVQCPLGQSCVAGACELARAGGVPCEAP